jgi:hypothetical protein
MPEEDPLATAPVLKLTDMRFFRELEERLNEITPEMLEKTPTGKISDTDKEVCITLGPMSEALKRFLCHYLQLVEEREQLFYDFFQNTAGKERTVLQIELDELNCIELRNEFVRTFFFNVLSAEYYNFEYESIGYFGPDFEVYVVP